MTLPKKPPFRYDWGRANCQKRSVSCRVCGRSDRKIELAHVWGVEADTRDAIVTVVDGQDVRLVTILPARVIPLCGPSVDSGTCHQLQHASRLDVWDHLTETERFQAITDAGGLGQALRKCAPLTWLDRVEIVNGEQREVFRGSCV